MTGKTFIQENFLLHNPFAVRLYYDYAHSLPIIDYHNHLPPQQMAANAAFANITDAWLRGDHYKWRAMRANGIPEQDITGTASDDKKFVQWAATVPATVRNPLYHWTHLELLRYFAIDDLLHSGNATSIYQQCNEQLKLASHSPMGLLQQRKVEVLCTTDDPCDTLEHHQQLQQHATIKVLPSFRPDRVLLINQPGFTDYIQQLGAVSNTSIENIDDLLQALQNRIDFFHSMGCRVSDHGLNHIPLVEVSPTAAAIAFAAALAGKPLAAGAADIYLVYMLQALCKVYHQKGWVQQLHLGAMRNNSTRLHQLLGPDCGADSIGDFPQAQGLAALLNTLDAHGQLAKTILYNLNPADNELFATLCGNYNDGAMAGKIQWGSAWWFLDQKEGMEKQLNTLSSMGLLSRFVGMLTDSRSFLSFTRHEYFRRILCNMVGNDIANGELPADIPAVGKIIQDICYYNAKEYFNFL